MKRPGHRRPFPCPKDPWRSGKRALRRGADDPALPPGLPRNGVRPATGRSSAPGAPPQRWRSLRWPPAKSVSMLQIVACSGLSNIGTGPELSRKDAQWAGPVTGESAGNAEGHPPTKQARPSGGASSAYSTSTGQRGRASRNARPYCLVSTRGSRITTMPVSVLVRMSRPTP